ncbi:hypothetical protein CC86DRAFT_413127 [Ophiobolus disseminans]|uniref:Uncharacterized protein n=1 Tax=Ophiobolus disseminans TaxID=1469910 RepID=A0A6A6ZEJ3_9PLEO|nr:hypothetical protein CC86DRAFT_413127 [Ophiobolus disseminans]
MTVTDTEVVLMAEVIALKVQLRQVESEDHMLEQELKRARGDQKRAMMWMSLEALDHLNYARFYARYTAYAEYVQERFASTRFIEWCIRGMCDDIDYIKSDVEEKRSLRWRFEAAMALMHYGTRALLKGLRNGHVNHEQTLHRTTTLKSERLVTALKRADAQLAETWKQLHRLGDFDNEAYALEFKAEYTELHFVFGVCGHYEATRELMIEWGYA